MDIIDIPNAETLKTKLLTHAVLKHLYAGNRVRFYVSRGKGKPTVQCIRVMLSRVRKAMEAKNRRYKRFRLKAHVFPHTDVGENPRRTDCVIFQLVKDENHDMMEILEDLMANA